MSDETELDRAHMAMELAPDDDAARLAFYGRLTEGELFVLLDSAPKGDSIVPRLFPLEEGPYVLVFDTEARLTDFAAGPAPYAAMPGRRVAALLARQGVGLALNLGAAPSQMMLPPELVDWLAGLVAAAPQALSAKIERLAPPSGVPDALLTALDRTLTRAGGLAQLAYLCGVTYADGGRSHLLAFVAASPGAETVLAQAVNDALVFSGVPAGSVDVVFVAASDPVAARMARWGLRIDLSGPGPDEAPAPKSDPAPPRLR